MNKDKKSSSGLVTFFCIFIGIIIGSVWWHISSYSNQIKTAILISFILAYIIIEAYLFYRRIFHSLPMKVGRLIEAKDYEEVIRLTKDIPYDKMDISIQINLSGSYYFLNKHEDAKAVFKTITEDKIQTEFHRKAYEFWEEKLGMKGESPHGDRDEE